jgi:hypothetical protein
MDLILDRMANRGMDGVGIWKGGCYPHHIDHYALQVLVKGALQSQVEQQLQTKNPNLPLEEIRTISRREVLAERGRIMGELTARYLQGLGIDAWDGLPEMPYPLPAQ